MYMHTIFVNIIELVLLLLIIFPFIEKQTHVLAGVDAPNIIVDNIQTDPHIVRVGDYFILNATVKNISNNTVDILNFGCDGPIKVIFDKNVEVKSITSGICFNPEQTIALNPGKATILSAPGGIEDYKAISEGTVKATLQLDYIMRIGNLTAPLTIHSNESTYVLFLSKPFAFKIFPN
jgi:hypothetical protein